MIKNIEITIPYEKPVKLINDDIDGPLYRMEMRETSKKVYGQGFIHGGWFFVNVDKKTSLSLRALGSMPQSYHTDHDIFVFSDDKVRFLSNLEILVINNE